MVTCMFPSLFHYTVGLDNIDVGLRTIGYSQSDWEDMIMYTSSG